MLDKPGLLFLTITSVLFLACSFYAFGYLAGEAKSKKQVFEEETFFTNAPEAIFCACVEGFLATMTLGNGEPAFWFAVGSDGGDDTGKCAIDIFSSPSSFP